MASDKERLEIVKKLRRTANDDINGLSLQRNLAAITKAEDGSWRGVMRRLADLIDRPTCEMKSIPKSSYRVCSRCGAFVKRDAVTNCTEAIPVRFCPNCDAKVVKGDE